MISPLGVEKFFYFSKSSLAIKIIIYEISAINKLYIYIYIYAASFDRFLKNL
jgi:hypothetical protein